MEKTIKRRARRISAKPGELKVAWGLAGDTCPEICYAWGAAGATSAEARILSGLFEDTPIHRDKTFFEILEERGYDLTTLKFSVSFKKDSNISLG